MPATAGTPIPLPPSAASGLQNSDAATTLEYLVVLSQPDATNGAKIARDATGIPAVGATLSGTSLVVLRKRADPIEGDGHGINYRVTVEYGINASTGGGGSTGEPWTSKDRISRRVQAYTTFKSTDLAGNPIENSAHDPIQGGLAFDEFNPIRVVRRYRRFTTFNPEAAEACVGTLNNSIITLNPQRGVITIPAKRALLRNFTCDDALWPDTGDFYYDIMFELEIEYQVPLEYYYVTNKGWFYLDQADSGTKKPYVKTVTINGREIPTHGETFLLDTGDKADSGQYQGTVRDPVTLLTTPNYDLQFTRRLATDWTTWIAT